MASQRSDVPDSGGPNHVAVLVGSESRWNEIAQQLLHAAPDWAAALSQLGVGWLTVRPVDRGDHEGVATAAGPLRAEHPVGGCCVVLDGRGDGRARLADCLAEIDVLSEERVSASLNAPAPGDPDLIVLASPSTTLPQSVVWELAYAELVYLESTATPSSEQLVDAVRQYTGRHRRFGGL